MAAKLVVGAEIYEVEPGVTIADALDRISIPGESVLAIADGKLVSDSHIIQDGDQIKLVFVISGG